MHVDFDECCRAPKSQEVYRALLSAKSYISQYKGPQPGVPLHLRNAVSKLTKDLGNHLSDVDAVQYPFSLSVIIVKSLFSGWGQNYNSRHCGVSGLTYMPDGLEDVNFFSARKTD